MSRQDRPSRPAVWTSSYNNLNSGPGRWAYDEVVHSRRMFPSATESVSNYSVPKTAPYHERHRTEISDEFRFLEERSDAPEKQCTTLRRHFDQLPKQYWIYVCVSVAVLQFIVALALLVFAIIRYIRLFQGSPAGNDVLLDFVKSEDFADTNQAGTEIIAIKLGSATLVPSILQLVSSVVLCFLVNESANSHLVLLHTILTCTAVVLWFEPIYIAALELNLRYVQLVPLYDSANFRILIAVLCLAAIDVVLVGSVLTVFVCASSTVADKTAKSSLDLHVGTVTLVLSVVSAVLSAYATANSMTNITAWENPLRNFTALYALGLKELVVSAYAILVSAYSTAAAVVRYQSLRLGSIVLQTTLLVALTVYVLNADRLTSVTHNAQRMLAARSMTPFSGEILILLYAFLALLTIGVLVQLMVNAVNAFRLRPLPGYRRAELEEQRSAL